MRQTAAQRRTRAQSTRDHSGHHPDGRHHPGTPGGPSFLRSGATVTTTHTCEGTLDRNGFYGEGIVNALTAVRR
jgi:hypothetical protein